VRAERQSPPVSRILFDVVADAVTIIPLGRRSPVASSHLPATSPSRIDGRLFGVAPRRDCPFHPTRLRPVGHVAFAPHPSRHWPRRLRRFRAAPFRKATLRHLSLTRLCRRA